jgi:hypothetical protein
MGKVPNTSSHSPAVASWPARHSPHFISPRELPAQAEVAPQRVDVIGRVPQLLQRISAIVGTGMTALRCDFHTLDHPDPVEPRRLSPPDADFTDSPNDATLRAAGFDMAWMRSAAAAGSDKNDAFAEEEQALAARFNVFVQGAALFSRSFGPYGEFLTTFVDEAQAYTAAIRDLADRRGRSLVQTVMLTKGQLREAEAKAAAMTERLDAAETELAARHRADERTNDAVGQAQRANMLLEQFNGELKAELKDAEKVNGIHSRRLHEAEKKIEGLEDTLKGNMASLVAMNRQLAIRQQLCDKLNQTIEAAFIEKSALQRQIVQLASRNKTVDTAGPTAKKAPQVMHAVASLEAFYDSQMQHMGRVVAAGLGCFKDGKTVLTPRPGGMARTADGTGTAARFVDLEGRCERLEAELAEVKERLQTLQAEHAPVAFQRLVVPGCLQALGEPHVPTSALYFLANSAKYFVALGDGPEVPAHLQSSGRVKNLRLTRPLVLQYAAQFFAWLNLQYTRERLVNGVNLCRCLSDWLCERFSAEEASTVAYSLHHALGQYCYEARLAFFLELLCGLPTAVHVAVEEHIDRFRDALARAVPYGEARISKRAGLAVVERCFCNYDDNDIARVMAALSVSHKGDGINVPTLFQLGPKGDESVLVAAVREMLLRDRWTYVAEVQASLLGDPGTATGVVTPHALVNALLRVDPRRPDSLVEATLEHVFGAEAVGQTIQVGDKATPLQERFATAGETCPVGTAIERIKSLPYGRFTKRTIAQAKLDQDAATVLKTAAGVAV